MLRLRLRFDGELVVSVACFATFFEFSDEHDVDVRTLVQQPRPESSSMASADNDESTPSLRKLAGLLSDSEADKVRAAIEASHRQHGEQVDRDAIAEAVRTTVLRESVDREPPAPVLDGSLPSDEEFYHGEIPEWTPDENAETTE